VVVWASSVVVLSEFPESSESPPMAPTTSSN
jgi:hypothetical protein